MEFSLQKIVSKFLGLKLSHIEHLEQQPVMHTEVFHALAATVVTDAHCPAASQILTEASKSAICDKLFYFFIYQFILYLPNYMINNPKIHSLHKEHN